MIPQQASTITVHDCIMRHGLDFNLSEPVSLPATSGRDFVGFVLQCGTKANHFKPGDRVAGLLRAGGNARYVEVPQDALVPVPKNLDGAEAACMVSVYTSAYQAINMATKDSSVYDLEGKRVLVVGGMDGTGQAIIQMCRKAKAVVFATAPDRRHAYVRSILNATPLPENPIDWSNEAKGSMDVVFDGNCEGDMKHSYRALSEKGRLVCFGQSSLLCEDMGWFGVPMERRLQRMKLEARSDTFFHDIWDSFRKDPDTYKVCTVCIVSSFLGPFDKMALGNRSLEALAMSLASGKFVLSYCSFFFSSLLEKSASPVPIAAHEKSKATDCQARGFGRSWSLASQAGARSGTRHGCLFTLETCFATQYSESRQRSRRKRQRQTQQGVVDKSPRGCPDSR